MVEVGSLDQVAVDRLDIAGLGCCPDCLVAHAVCFEGVNSDANYGRNKYDAEDNQRQQYALTLLSILEIRKILPISEEFRCFCC